ncbi:MAG: DUF4932 domain-containing protein [Chitinophagaceae bacterium]|nr:DUF4932 domain-containing protein [Chitinophagaceae bacterium]
MNKRLIIFFFAFLGSITLYAQPVANPLLPKVDNRIELLSIVFKLAIADDFNDTKNPRYTNSIRNHFTKYSAHLLIEYVRSLIDSFQKDSIDIGSWEIPSLALHLSQPHGLEPLVSFSDSITSDGWDNRTLLNLKFVTLLKQFYTDARCEAFFKSQEAYYALVNQAYEKQSKKLNGDWIKNFFSVATTENYYGILNLQGLGNGDYIRVNFKNNHRNTHTIFECAAFDENGVPSNFSNPIFERNILHEYIHAFTNQVIDNNLAALQKPAETILASPKVFKLMKNTFYGNWQYLLYESLVRACTIKYMMSNEKDNTTATKEIIKQEELGFFWIKGLVEKLSIYENNRKKYKNLEAFMPEVIKYFRYVADIAQVAFKGN